MSLTTVLSGCRLDGVEHDACGGATSTPPGTSPTSTVPVSRSAEPDEPAVAAAHSADAPAAFDGIKPASDVSIAACATPPACAGHGAQQVIAAADAQKVSAAPSSSTLAPAVICSMQQVASPPAEVSESQPPAAAPAEGPVQADRPLARPRLTRAAARSAAEAPQPRAPGRRPRRLPGATARKALAAQSNAPASDKVSAGGLGVTGRVKKRQGGRQGKKPAAAASSKSTPELHSGAWHQQCTQLSPVAEQPSHCEDAAVCAPASAAAAPAAALSLPVADDLPAVTADGIREVNSR